MGGSGSGNFYHWQRPKKTTVEDCLSIDSNRWIREGILRSRIRLLGSWQCSYSGGKGFSLDYTVNTLDMQRPLLDLAYSGVRPGEREPRNESYTLRLTTTRPRFGGYAGGSSVRWYSTGVPAAGAWGNSTSRPEATTSVAGTATP